MNIFAGIILLALIADMVVHITADVLNLKVFSKELPEEFKDWYDADRYRRSQEYLKVNTRFGWIVSGFDLAVILLFWFGKGFPFLDHWARGWQAGPIGTGLIYIAALLLLKAAISLPFSVYHTFVIEERFGFNKTRAATFVADIGKGLVLALLLGTPLLAGILFFFESAGPYAWLFCWLGVTLYMLAVQFIAPAWIMPLFNKFTPLDDGPLRAAIVAYAQKIRFPLENVFVMDGSRRTGKSNAFFTGFGKHKRIALFDTLIEQHSIAELVGILAHEMGHYKKKHILVMLVIGVMQTGLMFYLLSIFITAGGLFAAFYMPEQSIYAGLIFFGMLFAPVEFFLGIAIRVVSRRNEYAADRFAVETTSDARALGHALKKLSVHNLSNLTPHPAYVVLNYSHPPIMERLRAISS